MHWKPRKLMFCFFFNNIFNRISWSWMMIFLCFQRSHNLNFFKNISSRALEAKEWIFIEKGIWNPEKYFFWKFLSRTHNCGIFKIIIFQGSWIQEKFIMLVLSLTILREQHIMASQTNKPPLFCYLRIIFKEYELSLSKISLRIIFVRTLGFNRFFQGLWKL